MSQKAIELHQFTFMMSNYDCRLLSRRNTQLNCVRILLKTITQKLTFFVKTKPEQA